MPIDRRSARDGGFGLKRAKIRCWECGLTVAAAVIDPASQNPLCQKCAGSKWSGVEVIERAETPEKD